MITAELYRALALTGVLSRPGARVGCRVRSGCIACRRPAHHARAHAARKQMAQAEMAVGNFVVFKDNKAFSGVIFEFQDDGMVAGLRNISQKLKDSGAPEETHEPVENLEIGAGGLKIGDVVTFKSDGPSCYGTVFEFQDEGMVAGLKDLSEKLKGMGEPVENLEVKK